MNIEEAQIKKEMIESQILLLIQQFEKDTDLEVLNIYLEKIYNVGRSSPSIIHVELGAKL